jgi:choline dehydrogenase-like flavoprotein
MDFPAGQTLRCDAFERDEAIECDVALIGSGAGGAAAAWVLSQAGLKVLIIEEGRKFEPDQLSTKQSWSLRNIYAERGASLATGNVYLPIPRGRVVGGSTVLNSAICFRTPATILKRWQEEFEVPWADLEHYNPVFAEIESAIGVAKTQPVNARAHNLIFKVGVDALKLDGDFISRNAPGCVGCGLCQLGCPIGGKGSVDRNLIPVSLSHGAALLTCARATSIVVENQVARGVEVWAVDPVTEERRRRIQVKAKKVFLCAGAVGSPMLLLRQGLANSSGQVGDNLRVHTGGGITARFEQIIDVWQGVTQGYYTRLQGENAVLETFSATPEIYAIGYEEYSRPVDRLRHVASCGCMIGDVSTGRVRPGPSEQRSVMTYDVGDEDRRVHLKGLLQIAKIYFAAGAIEVHPGIVGGGTFKSADALEKFINQGVPVDHMSLYASHPMGTCRMSGDKTRGVVKPTGESWDVEGLYVSDASVFPTSLGVNPQITVMSTSVQIARQALRKG